MTKYKLITACIIFLTVNINELLAHCQVPCGIYNDAARIVQIEEDIATIKKAMTKISDLAGRTDAQSLNQITRWVTTKEAHAQNVQETILNYFLAQRIKEKEKGDEGRQKYVDQTLLLHQLIVVAMKCKQTVDLSRCDAALKIVQNFTNSYFDDHGIEHIKSLKKG